ncbi:MAG: sulfur carrier protein ThiS [Proteobacteria bacterium]|nr:sulfur carrier protein ThiS [Pseudomonadota bacterium]
MTLRLNGEAVEVPDGVTVSELLAHLGRDPSVESIAVAHNLNVVPREEHPTRNLAEGDRVDIVTAVGGG